MIKKIKKYKVLITVVSVFTIAIVLLLTIDAIYDTNNWNKFSIDFEKSDHIISAYGTLIGGVLAFLSILFVIYQVLEQREQIFQDKKDVKKEKIEEKKDLLILMSSFLSSIIVDIKNQGKDLKLFYEKELQHPTKSNQTYFTVNENFNRIVEMDYMSVYKSFRYFFKDEKDWEKRFLNFYRNIDFYLKMTPHLREKYSSQLDKKVKLKYSIQSDIQSILTNLNNIRNKYIRSFKIPYNFEYSPYFNAINGFFFSYRNYINYIENSSNSQIDSDLSDLKITYFKPLFDELLNLMKNQTPMEFDEIDTLIKDLGAVIIKIKQLEVFAINYAYDVKKHCDSYYVDDNINLKSLIELKELIDLTLKKKMSKKKTKVKLARAYELRDFEISHYWKRAQYFWGFLAVIYAGFFATLIGFEKDDNFSVSYILIICSVGSIFSFAWYLVNRGSKMWQEHWEHIINLYEKELDRELYSIKPKVKSEFFNAGKFSVSRINIVVSFLVFLSWFGLWIFTVAKYSQPFKSYWLIAIITLIGLFLVYFFGKGKKRK